MGRQLSDVQSTVRAIQQALQLADEQIPAFFRQHVASLMCSSERVAQTLQTAAELLAVPVASTEMRKVVMACHPSLFNDDPAVIHDMVIFYCSEFKGGQCSAKGALKQNIYWISADSMGVRADALKILLGWTADELNKAVNANPNVLIRKTATVANNIQKLHAHSFTSAQALDMYASFPSLAGFDWSSPSNIEKLAFFTCVLQLSKAELASKPQLLATSLENKLGPRSEFLYRSKGLHLDMPFGLSCFSSYAQYTDARTLMAVDLITTTADILHYDAESVITSCKVTSYGLS